jgi:hypothetical protein
MSETEKSLTVTSSEIVPLFDRAISNVREEVRDNPYITEALRVLQVEGYRSAIGCVWNAVVDDLRNKIMFRSIDLFNKSLSLRKQIKTYEDFQDYVNDDELIEGAYKIGVISWEANKVLRHAKETRHIFDGHPKSSDPSMIKVLAMLDDCTRYVLSVDYPPQIIDIDEYIGAMGESGFDRNIVSIEMALGDLPEVYKNELANRLYTTYIRSDTSSALKSNIAFVAPVLWKGLPKEIKIQISRRVDQEISRGDKTVTDSAFEFIRLVESDRYLPITARRYKVQPIVQQLSENLYNFSVENNCIKELQPYASFIPEDLLELYISSITLTYVGTVGSSARFNRTDWYADIAATMIPSMFEQFDDRMSLIFVDFVKNSDALLHKISRPTKLRRLRNLAIIVAERISNAFSEIEFIEILTNEGKEEDLFRILRAKA